MTKEELQDIKEWVAKGWGLSIEESMKLITEIERLQQLKERYEQTLRRIANPKRDASKEYYRL